MDLTAIAEILEAIHYRFHDEQLDKVNIRLDQKSESYWIEIYPLKEESSIILGGFELIEE